MVETKAMNHFGESNIRRYFEEPGNQRISFQQVNA